LATQEETIMAKAKTPKLKDAPLIPEAGTPLSPAIAGDSGETTGRFVVIFKEGYEKDPSRPLKTLQKAAGVKNLAAAADYKESAVDPRDLSKSTGVYFNALGIAVVSSDKAAISSLAAEAADADSPILAIEPEYRAYALSSLLSAPNEYLRGYKDAVNHLYEKLAAPGAQLAVEAAAAAIFQDTNQLTWGLQATRVHTSHYDGQGIRLAVLDTGLDLQHPDFRGRVIVSQTFVPGQAVQDGHRHGTHCIGTACGPKQPASGVRRYGIAYASTIYAGKVLNNQGSGSTAGIVAGLEWAVTAKCQVVSMSLGANIDQKIQQYEVPIARALRAGTLVVAAAGNNADRSAGNPGFVGPPANADAAMAVAAVDNQLAVANFSARSSSVTGIGGKVNISGPGVKVFSSIPVAFGKHSMLSGTSMATPHVAGIAALWCQATGARGVALWAKLEQSARPLSASTLDVGFGLGQAPQ